MISSTVEDLAEERAAVERVIRDFHFERFRSESMGSFARSAREVCEQAARDCDVFVLLLGPRYGWVIPDLDISVVEREYDVARYHNPAKILVYVVTGDDPEPRQREFIARVTDFTSGYFRARPITDRTMLRQRVREDLSNWISERIVAAGLEPSRVLSVPTPIETVRSTLRALAVLFAVAGMFAIAGEIPALQMNMTSRVSGILDSFVDRDYALWRSLLRFWLSGIAAILFGTMVASCVALAALLLPPVLRLIRLMVLPLIVAAGYFYLFAGGIVGHANAATYAATATLAVTLLLPLMQSVEKTNRRLRLRFQCLAIVSDLALQTKWWRAILVVVAALAIHNLLFGVSPDNANIVDQIVLAWKLGLSDDVFVAAFLMLTVSTLIFAGLVNTIQAIVVQAYTRTILNSRSALAT